MSNPFDDDTEEIKDSFDYEAHLKSTKEEVLTYAGQPGCNPYVWLNQNYNPLVIKWTEGDRSEELKAKIKSLKAEKPLVDLQTRVV